MKKLNVILGGIVCLVCICLIIALTSFQKEDPLILGTNPKVIIAGEKFNEIDGIATLGANGRNFNEYDKIYINGVEQLSTVAEDRRVVTCLVEDELYQLPGVMEVQVKRVKQGQVIRESNIVKIRVQK